METNRYVVFYQCHSDRVAEILATLKLGENNSPMQSDLHGRNGYGFIAVVDMTIAEARSLRPKLEQAGAGFVAVCPSL